MTTILNTKIDFLMNQALYIQTTYEKALMSGDHETVVEAETDAYDLGHATRVKDRHIDDVPALFRSHSKLTVAWRQGWVKADEHFEFSKEMEHCSECNNKAGNPCPFHG